MHVATVSLLTDWKNFFVIVGSAAATLTGLMFVVITLVAGRRERRPNEGIEGIAAFSSPTVVHFCFALAVAAILSAPWHTLWHAGLLVGLAGLGGLAYVLVVARRMRRVAAYLPVLEDWLWHVVFPLVSYAALVVAAMLLPGNPGASLFVFGAATVLLLFIGIHNAWDTVTYIVVDPLHQLADNAD
jgi:hypothetical protein